MNEFIFFFHILAVIIFTLGALKWGKEALTVSIVIQTILANLFVTKQMTLFHFNVTCSDVFAIGGVLGLNLLQEFFSKDSAKRAAWICFYFMLFFAVMSQIHLLYTPSLYDTAHHSFVNLLSSTPRLLFASLATFSLVQLFDRHLFSRLKKKFSTAPLMFRNGLALICSQLLDTVLFSFLGLYGLVASMFDIIAVSFLIKLLIIFCITPCIDFSKKILSQTTMQK